MKRRKETYFSALISVGMENCNIPETKEKKCKLIFINF